MEKILGNELKKQFLKKIKLRYEDFLEYKEKSRYIWPGEKVFCWKVNNQISCFIILVIDSKGLDSFTVELAWSKLNRFPELEARCWIPGTVKGKEFEQSEYFCRMPELEFGKDRWWQIHSSFSSNYMKSLADLSKEEKKELKLDISNTIEPIVEDVFRMIRLTGLPFLKKNIELMLENEN